MNFPTDLEIAESADIQLIKNIADKLDIDHDDLEYYGKYKAKIPLKYIDEEKIKKAKLILVTAINPTPAGEGKTTVSMNSAVTLSSNKKVIIIGADLRNPQLKRYVARGVLGLSEYLADEKTTVDSIINHSGINSNLDIIDSGTIPPNPTDLLEDARLKLLIEDLVIRYDYVIIDSAPMMMVSDSFHILALADVLVYVTRAKYTEKQLLN